MAADSLSLKLVKVLRATLTKPERPAYLHKMIFKASSLLLKTSVCVQALQHVGVRQTGGA